MELRWRNYVFRFFWGFETFLEGCKRVSMYYSHSWPEMPLSIWSVVAMEREWFYRAFRIWFR